MQKLYWNQSSGRRHSKINFPKGSRAEGRFEVLTIVFVFFPTVFISYKCFSAKNILKNADLEGCKILRKQKAKTKQTTNTFREEHEASYK